MARLHPRRDFLIRRLLLLPYSGSRQSLPHRLDVNVRVSDGDLLLQLLRCSR